MRGIEGPGSRSGFVNNIFGGVVVGLVVAFSAF